LSFIGDLEMIWLVKTPVASSTNQPTEDSLAHIHPVRRLAQANQLSPQPRGKNLRQPLMEKR
jgi:hypothetical protein